MDKEPMAVKWLPSIEYLEDHLHALGWHKVVQCKNCMYWQNGLYCEMSHTSPWGADDYCSEGKEKCANV